MTRHRAIAGQKANNAGRDLDHSGQCPFCNILLAFPPVDPLDDPEKVAEALDHRKTNPPCTVIYSGQHVLAFLDIQPLTWGHTLVIPRRHRVKMGDLEAEDGAELGRYLPLITRAVMRAVFDLPYDSEKLEVEGADYNIVQNNGPLAAQVVPHVHHHIIPRALNVHPRFQRNGNPAPARLPQMTSSFHAAWTMFGRGYRADLDEEDPETQQLVYRIRVEIAREISRGDLDRSYGNAEVEERDDDEDIADTNKNNNQSNERDHTGTGILKSETGPYTKSASHDARNAAGTSDHEHESTFPRTALAPTDSKGSTPEKETEPQPGQVSHRDQLPSLQEKRPQKQRSIDVNDQEQQQKHKSRATGFQGGRAWAAEITDNAREPVGKGKL